MKRLLISAVSLLFISVAAMAAPGPAVGSTNASPPIAPKDIELKDELAKKDPKTLTKKEKEKLERKKLLKAESLRNSAEGI